MQGKNLVLGSYGSITYTGKTMGCLAAHSLISTEKGFEPIGSLVTIPSLGTVISNGNNLIYTPNGYLTASAFHNSGVRETLKLFMEDGSTHVCTGDQGWLVSIEGKFSWVDSDSLKPDMEIATLFGGWPRKSPYLFKIPQNIMSNYIKRTSKPSGDAISLEDDFRLALLAIASKGSFMSNEVCFQGGLDTEWRHSFEKVFLNSRRQSSLRNTESLSLPREFFRFAQDVVLSKDEGSLYWHLCRSTRKSACNWIRALLALGYTSSLGQIITCDLPDFIANVFQLLLYSLGHRSKQIRTSKRRSCLTIDDSIIQGRIDLGGENRPKTRKLLSLQRSEPQIVYDLTVPPVHAFVSNGLVARNSMWVQE